MTSQSGFLLSYIKYGDRDAILQCFTKENGYQTFFVKGIYSPKNRKKAYLLPLNELCFNFSAKPSRSEVQQVSAFEPLHSLDFYLDVKASAMVFFAADFLKRNLRNEQQNAQIYDEITVFVRELQARNYRAHLIFLVKMVQNSGVSPLINNCSFLNPESGIFEHETSHQFFDENISTIWKEVMNSENPYSVKIPPAVRAQFLESILIYCHYHITDFRTPDSLEIIQQIFE